MDRDYSFHYRELYERHWWWRAREALILATLDRWKPQNGWPSILDVGCGDGLFFEQLQRFGAVEGIEMDPAGLRRGGPWADLIRVGPFDHTFQPAKTYSLVLMLDVLEHFPDAVAAFRRAADLLEPDGVLIVTVPAFPLLWTSHDELNRHFTRFTRATLSEVIGAAPVRVLQMRYFFHWMAPLKLAIRAKERIFGATPATPAIPPDWLNELLHGISKLEERTIGRIAIPFGSSLLAVVRRE